MNFFIGLASVISVHCLGGHYCWRCHSYVPYGMWDAWAGKVLHGNATAHT